MASGDPRMNLEVQPHHEQRRICASRAKYREGRKPRAVKVYTVNLESRYLLVQGVPAIGVMEELVEQFALYGAIEEYNVLDEYPTEEFAEVYLIKFQRLQSARVAKRKQDERSFFGGLLHVCYAPEFENVQETREKLQQRRRYVARATADKVASKRPEESESSPSTSVHSTVNRAHASSCHSSVQSGDPTAPFAAPPPWVTPDYRHETCPPPPSLTPDYRRENYPPPPSMTRNYKHENYPPPPPLTPDYRHENYPPPPPLTPDYRHENYPPPPSMTPDYRCENYPPLPSLTPAYRHENYPPLPSLTPDYRRENYLPPPSLTPDYRHENYPPPPSLTPDYIHKYYPPPPSVTSGYRHKYHPSSSSVTPDHRPENYPPPPSVTPDHRQDYCPPLHSSAGDGCADHTGRTVGPAQGQPIIASSARFMPRTTQLQERQRRREEETKWTLIPPESLEIIIGPKLPEIPKLDLADDSLNLSADLIRARLKEASIWDPKFALWNCMMTQPDHSDRGKSHSPNVSLPPCSKSSHVNLVGNAGKVRPCGKSCSKWTELGPRTFSESVRDV